MEIKFRKEWAILAGTHLAAAAAGAAAWHYYATRVALPEDEPEQPWADHPTLWDHAEEFIKWNPTPETVKFSVDGEEEAIPGSYYRINSAPKPSSEEAAEKARIEAEVNTGEEVLETHHVFGDIDDAGADGLWDWAAELATREDDDVYVLHEAEYFAKEMEDYDQTTLFWYNGDKILTDSNEVIIYNVTDIIGEFAFGHGSKDPNKFFVRNDRMRSEYEVLLIDGTYENEVLNRFVESAADDEDLKHSMRMYKFKME